MRTVPHPGGDGFEVFRIDPRTGDATSVGRHVPGPAGIEVAAVEPGGGRLALTAPTDGGTLVLDFDPARGGGDVKPTFEGTVDPKRSPSTAPSCRGPDLPDRYHVHVLDLATGEQRPTLGPDKEAPEDMFGGVVQAVLSPDGTELATLYHAKSVTDHTAFVHLLSLESGLTVCVDLHKPRHRCAGQ